MIFVNVYPDTAAVAAEMIVMARLHCSSTRPDCFIMFHHNGASSKTFNNNNNNNNNNNVSSETYVTQRNKSMSFGMSGKWFQMIWTRII